MDERRIQELERRIELLEAGGTIPHETEQAFRERFNLARLEGAVIPIVSAKAAASEARAVNESGSSSYSVMQLCDGFVEVLVGGTTYYLPTYNA
jgi:hypothetical protein